jgi:hypothetical protein
MAPGEAEPNGRRSFFTTLPGILTGVAALITAVVSLIAVFGPDDNGNGNDTPSPEERAALRAYQQSVISVCDQDREQEVRFKRKTEQLEQEGELASQQLQAGDSTALEAYFESVLTVLDEAIADQAAIKGELEALEPPEDLQGTHDDAVALWGRSISTIRSASRQLATARDDFFATGDPAVLTDTAAAVDDPELEAQSDRIDTALRRLGGPGCDPAP